MLRIDIEEQADSRRKRLGAAAHVATKRRTGVRAVAVIVDQLLRDALAHGALAASRAKSRQRIGGDVARASLSLLPR